MEGKAKKTEAPIKAGFSPERNELSMHSEGLAENDQEGSEKFFSFNQSFTNIEHNNKLIQEKTNSLHRVRALEDEIKSYKSRSALWEKVKSEIIALNKYLQLSALSLDCSDSAIMREFFQAIRKILADHDEKEKDEKWKMAELSKQNKDLFEKLVVSNKMRYELEQELDNYKHDISRLSEINTSLREKSRAQSTERSSKIQEFHQETILTINQKQLELTNLEQHNYDLRRQVSERDEQLSSLRKELNQKEDELLSQAIEIEKMSSEFQALSEELKREREKTVELKKRSQKCKEEQKETEGQIIEIKEYLKNVVEENISIRTELTRRAQQISELRMVIKEAKNANEQFIQEQTQIAEKEKEREKQRIAELLQQEIAIKKKLKASLRFGVNDPQRTRSKKKVPSRNSIELEPSSEELLI